jgi:hypothetical protein
MKCIIITLIVRHSLDSPPEPVSRCHSMKMPRCLSIYNFFVILWFRSFISCSREPVFRHDSSLDLRMCEGNTSGRARRAARLSSCGPEDKDGADGFRSRTRHVSASCWQCQQLLLYSLLFFFLASFPFMFKGIFCSFTKLKFAKIWGKCPWCFRWRVNKNSKV